MDQISLICNFIKKDPPEGADQREVAVSDPEAGVADSFPPVVVLSRVTARHMHKLFHSFQAVEILKTAREISMRVRFFPYSKWPTLFYSPDRALGWSSPSTDYWSSPSTDCLVRGHWELRPEK